jgi:hypothetical protein
MEKLISAHRQKLPFIKKTHLIQRLSTKTAIYGKNHLIQRSSTKTAIYGKTHQRS